MRPGAFKHCCSSVACSVSDLLQICWAKHAKFRSVPIWSVPVSWWMCMRQTQYSVIAFGWLSTRRTVAFASHTILRVSLTQPHICPNLLHGYVQSLLCTRREISVISAVYYTASSVTSAVYYTYPNIRREKRIFFISERTVALPKILQGAISDLVSSIPSPVVLAWKKILSRLRHNVQERRS